MGGGVGWDPGGRDGVNHGGGVGWGGAGHPDPRQ